MLAQLVVGPWATLYTLGHVKYLALALWVVLASSILGSCTVTGGIVGLAEHLTVGWSIGLAGLTLSLFGYVTYYQRLESNFDTHPWRIQQPATDDPGSSDKKKSFALVNNVVCPFSSLPPNLRCYSCQTNVHESAYNAMEKYTTFVVGEQVLRWDLASAALERRDNPAQARIELDEALDFRGNVYFSAVGDGCAGCAAWARSFSVAPRWALSLAFMAVFFAVGPWAFQQSLSVKTIAAPKGERLQLTMELAALYFGVCSLLLQLQAICQALVFMTKYADVVAFPYLVKLPDRGWQRWVCRWLSGMSMHDIA